jgi:hypothetical protein
MLKLIGFFLNKNFYFTSNDPDAFWDFIEYAYFSKIKDKQIDFVNIID